MKQVWVDWHQAHWLELARQSSQVRRLGAGREWGGPDQGAARPRHTPSHTLYLGPAGLTGCRAGDTLPDSSGRPDPGRAGCTLRPPCGWCSDATHRRGPGRMEEEEPS